VKTTGLAVSDRELRDLLVGGLELLTEAEFDTAAAAAQRRRLPLERAACASTGSSARARTG
jgi:hypothetical protein